MMPKERVQFEGMADCPNETASKLLAAQNKLGPMSDTHALACALTFLRGANSPVLRKSALASRLCLNLAERETDPLRREELAAEGVGFAETALANSGKNDGAVHYYLATNLGLAVRDHLTLAMDNMGRLESEMKQALALSPGLDDGGPMRILGTLYLKAPGWPNGIGDVDKAVELLGEAVKKHPGHPLNHLFYAQALWEADEDGNSVKVKAELAEGMKLLEEGQWGYRKEPWKREFDAFIQEVDANSGAKQPPLAQAR